MEGRPVALGMLDALDGSMFSPTQKSSMDAEEQVTVNCRNGATEGLGAQGGEPSPSPAAAGTGTGGTPEAETTDVPEAEVELPPIRFQKLSPPSLVSAECRSLVVKWEPAAAAPLDGGMPDARDLPALKYILQMQEVKVKPGKEQDPTQRIASDQWAAVEAAGLQGELTCLKPGLRYAVRVLCQLAEESEAAPKMPEPSEPVLLFTVPAPPSAPTPVTLTTKERKALKFKWPVPEEKGGYEDLVYTLELCPPPDAGATGPEVSASVGAAAGFAVVYSGTDTSFKATKLAPGVKYSVRATAHSSLGPGPCSFVGEFRTAPAVPQRPEAPEAAAGGPAVLLRWTPPHDNGAEITRYHVQQAPASNPNDWTDVACVSGTECEVQGLRPAETYLFRLCCENDVGRSLFGAASEARTAAVPPRPPGPAAASGLSQHSANLAWGAPVWDGGSPVLSYEVQLFPRSPAALMGGLLADWVSVFQGHDTECAILGLRGGCRYSIRIRCFSAAGTSDYSGASEFVTAPEAPEAMRAPVVVSCGQTSLDLAWDPPAYDGGDPVQQFYVSVWNAATQSWDPSYTGPGLSATVGPLCPRTDYTFRVWCSNSAGTSPSSEVTTVSTRAAPPGPMDAPGVSGITSASVRAAWADPGHVGGLPVLRYALEKAMLGPGNENIAFTQVYEGPELSVDVKGLLPHSEYGFRVRAANAAGQGPWGAFCVCRTAAAPPGKPESLEVIYQGPDELCLGWSAPAEDNGSPVTSYFVEMNSSRKGSAGPGAWVQVHQGPETSCTVTGLLPGRPYSFRTRADNKAGAGGFSAPFSCSTSAAVPTCPPAPTFGRRTAQSVMVKWEAPGHDNGAPVSAYRVQLARVPSSEAPAALEWSEAYSGPDNSARVSGLQPGANYSFRVLASNEVGEGPWGPGASAATSLLPPGQMDAPSVSPADDPATEGQQQHHQLAVSWRAPDASRSCAAPVSYEVEAVEAAGPSTGGSSRARQVVTAGKGAHRCSVAGLPGDCDCHVRVRAVGAGGTGHGPWSEATAARTPPSRGVEEDPHATETGDSALRGGSGPSPPSPSSDGRAKKGGSRGATKQRKAASAAAAASEAKQAPAAKVGKSSKSAVAKPPPKKDRLVSKKNASRALQVAVAVLSLGFMVFLCMLAAKTQWRPSPDGQGVSKSYLEREWEVAYSREQDPGYISVQKEELLEILDAVQWHLSSGGADIPSELLRRAEVMGINEAMLHELIQLGPVGGHEQPPGYYDDPPDEYEEVEDDYY